MWHISSSGLLTIVADLWTDVLANRASATPSKVLDVAAVLWERLMSKHGLKSVAQRALGDLCESMVAEVYSDEPIVRIKAAAEIMGLGASQVPSLYLPCTFPVPSLYLPCTFKIMGLGASQEPWQEEKCRFFFWLLPL